MEINWLQSILLGCISGLTDILPVSAQAHRLVLLKLFGINGEPVLLRLLIHLSTMFALYYCCRGQILRLTRAQKLVKIPKRRRKRPLDTKSLMDYSLLKTTLIPIILIFLFYQKISVIESNLIIVAGILFVNGLILYIPQFFPTSTKDSSYVTRIEGLLLGCGAALSTVPGISCIGAVSSVGSVCGMDRKYTFNNALLMNITVHIGLIVYDVLALMEAGIGGLSLGTVAAFILAAFGTFAGVIVGINLLNKIISAIGYSIFAFYCWGAALFTFILSLTI